MIDTNVYLSRFPTRRLPYDGTTRLVNKLREAGITQAWAGSFDGMLHKDMGSLNRRLVEECQANGAELLVPFGSVNLALPDWQEDLRRCAEDHKMPGIRLHPNYHGYTLDDPRFAEMLALARRHQLIVQIAVKMEDERTQHPLLRVEPVDTAPLAGLATQYSDVRIVLLNSLRTLRADAIEQLGNAGQVHFEISMQEGVGGITKLLQQAPLERILFGSYFPFFYLESVLFKLRESELAQFQVEAITAGNAQRLLAGGA